MKCKKIQKKFISYLDGELRERMMNTVKNHLDTCSDCSSKIEMVARMWKHEAVRGDVKPPVYLWNTIRTRIDDYERSKTIGSVFHEMILRYTPAAATAAVFFAGICIGIFLGNVPLSRQDNTTAFDPDTGLVETRIIDTFHDLPPESVGGVYVVLIPTEQRGKSK
jgi:predicted anti-sigma-YlaC factor YlaD